MAFRLPYGAIGRVWKSTTHGLVLLRVPFYNPVVHDWRSLDASLFFLASEQQTHTHFAFYACGEFYTRIYGLCYYPSVYNRSCDIPISTSMVRLHYYPLPRIYNFILQLLTPALIRDYSQSEESGAPPDKYPSTGHPRVRSKLHLTSKSVNDQVRLSCIYSTTKQHPSIPTEAMPLVHWKPQPTTL